MRRRRSGPALGASLRAAALLVSALAAAGAPASTLRYSLEIPDGQEGAFEVQFPVDNPGTLQVLAEWSGARVLALRVENPGEAPTRWRRSGPSPQVVSVEVPPEACVVGGGDWKLSIRALAARGEAKGTITIDVPDPPTIVKEREAARAPKPPPPRIPESWEVEAKAPAGAGPDLLELYRGVEDLRFELLGSHPDARSDACGWQIDLLRALAGFRERLGAGGAPPSAPTLRYLDRLALAVQRIDDLRRSTDPILAGPEPEESLRRRAWLAVRKERLSPLVEELDSLGEALRKGYVPELVGEAWASRFVACLTACERHFEERARVGSEEAANHDLAEAQWDRFLLARRALAAVARFLQGPPPAPAPAVLGAAPDAPADPARQP